MPLSTWIYYILRSVFGAFAAASFVAAMALAMADDLASAKMVAIAGIALTVAFYGALVYGEMPASTTPNQD